MEKHLLRRKTLGARFSRTAFVVSAGTQKMRSHSVGFRHKTPSDFFYLCGLEIAEALLVVIGQSCYFLQAPQDLHKQMWGDEEALNDGQKQNLQEVQFVELAQLEAILLSHRRDYDRIATALGTDAILDQKLLALVSYQKGQRSHANATLGDSRVLIGSLRSIKEDFEIAQMREAAQRSSRTHDRMMRQNWVGKTEQELCDWIESDFLLQGMRWTAYETIVGSGERGKVLHARASRKVIGKDDMVLVDAGGEWNAYCADITRVFAASGKFSEEQKNIYEVVLTAQKAVLSQIAPGKTLPELHALAEATLAEGLALRGYAHTKMPHQTSHWIGLDVHDPSVYVDDRGEALKLEKGMTFTVEPGLYLQECAFGVRIEDDVVVTAAGCEVLSCAVKEIKEMEDLYGSKI